MLEPFLQYTNKQCSRYTYILLKHTHTQQSHKTVLCVNHCNPAWRDWEGFVSSYSVKWETNNSKKPIHNSSNV